MGEIADRPPVLVAADQSVREAAAAMTEARVTAALVEPADGSGIVTDADLREHVLAAGLGPDDPVRVAVRSPALTAPADRTAGEALIDLLDAGVRELLVTGRDADGGTCRLEDIAGGEHSPFALRRAIARAPDEDTLVASSPPGCRGCSARCCRPGWRRRRQAGARVQSDTATRG